MAAKKTGRPSKLTPEAKDRFILAIKLGSPYELACKYAGISYQTLQNWRAKTESDFLEFFEDVGRAEGEAVVQWLAVLQKHSEATGQWAAWKLERRYPHDFGRRDRMPVDVSELDRQFEAEVEQLIAGREADIPSEAKSEAVN